MRYSTRSLYWTTGKRTKSPNANGFMSQAYQKPMASDKGQHDVMLTLYTIWSPITRMGSAEGRLLVLLDRAAVCEVPLLLPV